MFERICINPKQPTWKEFDLGSIAEALLFYGDVILLVGENSLESLLRQCGPELLVDLIADQYIQIKYVNNNFATMEQNKNTPFTRYDFALLEPQGNDLETVAQNAFVKVTGKSGKGRRLAARFARLSEVTSYSRETRGWLAKDLEQGGHIESYLTKRFSQIRTEERIRLPRTVHFRFGEILNGGYKLITNIDFSFLQTLGPEFADLSNPSSVLLAYGGPLANVTLWSQYGADVAVTDKETMVIRERFNTALNKYNAPQAQLENFQDFIFNDSRAVAQSINSGRRSLNDVVPLLKDAKKFADWVKNKPLDQDLVKEYYKEITSKTWIDKLPCRTSRWLMLTGASVGMSSLFGNAFVGTVAGVALSAFDFFLLDKVARGWKPNQFIEDELKEFVSKGDGS